MSDVFADKSRETRSSGRPIDHLLQAELGAFFRPSQLEAADLTRHQLRALIRAGKVERIRRGLYRLVDVEPTEHYSLAMVCARVPRSIVCLLSALRVHGIGSQAPADVWIAIPHKARVPRFPELRLRVVRFSGPAWTFGVKAIDFEGVPARITSVARTIVDCFRFERLVGPEAPMEALQDALGQRKVSVNELSRVEQLLPSRRLRAVLDARSI
jgi:predicted transcriptional regulator of viral defense system